MAAAIPASQAKRLLPESTVYLGELGECVLSNPSDDTLYRLPYEPGNVLCAAPPDPDGYSREMFVIKPIGPGTTPRRDAVALSCIGLAERFSHMPRGYLHNCRVAPFRSPKFAGELVLIRYRARKDIGEVAGVEVWWEHYFCDEAPGGEPSYAGVWSVGSEQFFIPRGDWRVSERGIEYERRN